MYILRFSDEVDPDSVATLLSSFSEFEQVRVERYERVHFFGTKRHTPPDDRFDDQWNLDSSVDEQDIDAPEAWEIERGNPAVIIAITDTGTMVDTTDGEPWKFHSDLNKFVNTPEDVHNDNLMGYDDVNQNDSASDSDNQNDNVIGYNFTPALKGTVFEKAVWSSVPFNTLLEPGVPWEIFYYYPHGLSVASVAASKEGAANPGQESVCGVAPQCRVYQVRTSLTPDPDVPHEPGDFELLASPTLDAGAILHAAQHAKVMNMSWGFDFLTEDAEEVLHDAVVTATDPVASGGYDCVLVASVGNASEVDPDVVVAPARFAEVIGVGNMTQNLGLFYDSVYGPAVGNVSVVAPVDDGIPAVTQTQCFNGYPCEVDEVVGLFGGTSAASPQVAGLAALIRSRFPNLSQGQVVNKIINSAEWLWPEPRDTEDQKKYGSGKVNAYRALTEWGEVAASTTWSPTATRDGKYYISGDLTIKSGATLTIEAGTIVRVAPDHEKKGPDINRVQIVVESGGTLTINGTAQNPVEFHSFTDASATSNDWIGIKFESGSTALISHATFKNASVAIENYIPLTLTNCTFRDCGTAIDANANVTASGTLIASNSVGADIHTGAASFTKCTIAYNTQSATIVRGGSTIAINKCVTAFNGGPAVRVILGTATMQSSVVFGNVAAPPSPTDEQWQSTGQVVYNLNPQFCGPSVHDFRLYASSPAVAPVPPSQGYFGERVGAFDIGCIPNATVSVTPTDVVATCPAADGAVDLTINIDLDENVVSRTIAADELRLDIQDLVATVFDQDGLLMASTPATSPYYTTKIEHKGFGGRASFSPPNYVCSNSDGADVLLNGEPLTAQAVVTIRSPDLNGSGNVNVSDFALFGQGYPLDPAPPDDCRDFNDDQKVNIGDFGFYSTHNGHGSAYGPANAPLDVVQSSASVALQFTEEYPTATTHQLIVDVAVENLSGITTALFSLAARNERLAFAEWRDAGGSVGKVLFAPVARDGEEQLYFGILVSDEFTGANANLGQLVFDVTGTEPLDVVESDYVLVSGEVLLDSAATGPVVASMGGEFSLSVEPAVVRVYHDRLEQNYPNPFNPTTKLAYSIESSSIVNLTIYDVAGRRVRELVNESQERGAYQVVWDGANDTGATVSSGVYFYKLVAGSFTDTKKMTILK